MTKNRQSVDSRANSKNLALDILDMYSQHKWRSFGLTCSLFFFFIGVYGVLNPDGYNELFFSFGHPSEPYVFIAAFVLLFPFFSVLLLKQHLKLHKKK